MTNLISIIVTIISMIVTVICTIISLKYSSNNTSVQIKTSTNYYISNTTNLKSDDNLGLILVIMLIAAGLYSQYAAVIAITITVLGIISFLIITITFIYNNCYDAKIHTLLCISYILSFISIFLFLHPLITPNAATGIVNIFFKIYPMLGGILICYNFIFPVFSYAVKRKVPVLKDCILYLFVAVFSLLITSGGLLSIILVI